MKQAGKGLRWEQEAEKQGGVGEAWVQTPSFGDAARERGVIGLKEQLGEVLIGLFCISTQKHRVDAMLCDPNFACPQQ
ncbi:hypothetical protein ColLi_04122 [Colletotrichum liriopes]|uniref:Uncharacterized protein n=1 Tax=Colletotrichum liriopes TaxID=708192 RepID=A0AA37GHW3_9PEZI|nr:hypothetical protein ColLi_04122 [Colletotrichum liriopes]